jgi:hypothetical protein
MTRLRAVEAADTEWILEVLDGWEHCQRWGLQGRTPSPPLVHEVVGPATPLAQVAERPAGRRPVAVFHVDAVDPVNGFGHLGILADPAQRAEVQEGLQAFARLAFGELGLRKLCVAAAVDELRAEILGPAARPVGRFVAAERRGARRYVDVTAHELWREDPDR